MMKQNNMFFLGAAIALALSSQVAADANDNEVFISQTGDNIELTIRQIGAGNKFGGDDFSGTSAIDKFY